MIQPIFAPDKKELQHNIAAVLAEHLFLDISISDVLKMYDDLNTRGERRETEAAGPGFAYDQFGDRIIGSEYINAKLGGSQNIGVDFPIFYTPKESISTLMFAGMEPFRQKDIADKATIGTPFALHQTSQNRSGSMIRMFVHQLLKDNYSIYVTDISKVFAKKGRYKYVGEPETNQRIFEAELRLVAPSHLFVFGKSALTRQKALDLPTIPVIELTHPAAWGGNKKYYNVFTNAIRN